MGVLLGDPLDLGPLGPSVFFGFLVAAYLWGMEVWWMPRLAGVVAASIGGAYLAGFLTVITHFVLGILLPPSPPGWSHALGFAPGGLVQAGLLSAVMMTSWPKRGYVTRSIAVCSITGALLAVVAGVAAGERMLSGWMSSVGESIGAAVIWHAGMALMLAFEVEQHAPPAASLEDTSSGSHPRSLAT